MLLDQVDAKLQDIGDEAGELDVDPGALRCEVYHRAVAQRRNFFSIEKLVVALEDTREVAGHRHQVEQIVQPCLWEHHRYNERQKKATKTKDMHVDKRPQRLSQVIFDFDGLTREVQARFWDPRAIHHRIFKNRLVRVAVRFEVILQVDRAIANNWLVRNVWLRQMA